MYRPFVSAGGIIGLAALLAPTLLRGTSEVVVLPPTRDASLMEIAADRNNGGDGWILSGTTQNNTRNRALLHWDLSHIPAGATVLSVSLSFEVTRVPGCGIANSSFSLYRLLVPWGEGDKVAIDNAGGQGAPATLGDVTWNERFFGMEPWAEPGGLAGVDYVPEPSSTEYIYDVGRSPYLFQTSPEFVQDVQGWINDPLANFGWIFISDDEFTPFTARRFGAHEDENASPFLTIEYLPVPEPASLALIIIGLSAGAIIRRVGRRS